MANNILEMALELLEHEQKFLPSTLSAWFGDATVVSFTDNRLVLHSPSDFKQKYITDKFIEPLQNALYQLTGEAATVVVVTGEYSTPAQSASPYDDYTFERFIVGSSNKFAHAAAYAVAQRPAAENNPLFIYGPSGLGKTHLMHAIANEVHKNHPDYKIIYVTSEGFGNDLINGITSHNMSAFHEKYRSADVLLIDDIQFFSGKEQMQEEFFHTFNKLHAEDKQIVITSDKPPKELKTLEDRIRNRFEWGLIADIDIPDFETRIAIIRRKAELLDLYIPDDVAEFIANRLKTNIRQLEGAIKKLKALKHLAGSQPSISMAQSVIKDIQTNDQPIPITVEKIIMEVADVYGVTPEEIRSSKRSAQISTARKVAIYVVREITKMPLQSIGTEFGGRDHSTIVYAINNIEAGMKRDQTLKQLVDDTIKNICDKSNA